ncbi:hypothetical protein CGRA01v4_09979 [Colletotrichum graminicola]|uniref:Uncharacterized protein n=1 Tax=Colletotrichum graminicola (strain M1.001 / M2 / FGSC 10212) TaxID=645133 RepID=E3QHU9_COLGM|nr:uncharacterized protein GLRG_05581 [Colletotrichum graminicola M1.001]EFQ30437.1 hypothetical protein GLRG_05581 [Colletotrichum graminicola M1.001]WDK18694.1 hypothetical protein CGRA01v4_09979 [Colletotrichum graminicola]
MHDEPAPLLAILAKHKRIRHVSFLEGFRGASSDHSKSARLFAQTCTSPFAAALLGSIHLFVTAAFSAPLRRAAWLRDLDTGAHHDVPALRGTFPVKHIFVCQQFFPVEHVEKVDPETAVWPGWKTGSREVEEEKVDEPAAGDATYRPCHYFLGDALLNPGRFVPGFLQFCKSVLEDRYLVSFASTPSTAASPSSAWETGPIGPLPGEMLAIPEYYINMPNTQQAQEEDGDPTSDVQCWPLLANPDYVD